MRAFFIFLLLCATLGGCSNKDEYKILGKWTTQTAIQEKSKKISNSCSIEFEKTNAYIQKCEIVTYDMNNFLEGNFAIKTKHVETIYGDWIFSKEAKSKGFFVLNPKKYTAKLIQAEIEGTAPQYVKDPLLIGINQYWNSADAKSGISNSNAKIVFTIIEDKEDKLFLEITKTTEPQFPEGNITFIKMQ